MAESLIILGPTAVGKTAVSLLLAERLGGEIVSADAFQVYRGMDIATAKPSPEELARVPHHLIDILDPGEVYSAARFRELALPLIARIRGRGKVPIVVGGSGMYIRVLVDGIFPSPPADRGLRERLRKEEESEPGILHRRLARLDPVSAERIHPRNLKRIVRALEVRELTGSPISGLQREWDSPPEPSPGDAFRMIGLRRERADLYGRIDRRAAAMFAGGLLEETRRLREAGKLEEGPARLALGYREAAGCLRGEYGEEAAVRRLAAATRRFARRQLTWWRDERRIEWFDLDPESSPEETADRVLSTLGLNEVRGRSLST